eukprot:TRINITY_DN34061_c0_g2_i2.p1 TRINITY_DN34061_c0_g2~~TRINITY_DN34061_c0_g2_i2.p1  ORF type:complete len:226 (-),score=3.86 TRINITY_DN34061_c0_g2_i2:64-711(-)
MGRNAGVVVRCVGFRFFFFFFFSRIQKIKAAQVHNTPSHTIQHYRIILFFAYLQFFFPIQFPVKPNIQTKTIPSIIIMNDEGNILKLGPTYQNTSLIPESTLPQKVIPQQVRKSFQNVLITQIIFNGQPMMISIKYSQLKIFNSTLTKNFHFDQTKLHHLKSFKKSSFTNKRSTNKIHRKLSKPIFQIIFLATPLVKLIPEQVVFLLIYTNFTPS